MKINAISIALVASVLALSMTDGAMAANSRALNAPDVNAFLDGFMPMSIQRGDIAGATVVVVKDGKVLTIRNYGYADVASQRPVSDATMFRIGSISKLFVWTAVMQQVERDKLNLDRDLNAYLDFTIPPGRNRPITLRDLMTHSAGFEETFKDIEGKSRLEPLGVYLKSHVPARIFPPGSVVAYSNYGATLASYIVQRVSGEPYDRYVEEHIFKPLQMNHTTLQQPPPRALSPYLSSGYSVASAPAKPFEYTNLWPAGSVSTTASDMANFMIAHLQNGAFHGSRILKPGTARTMHDFVRTDAPGINGMDLGFYQENRNGQRIIGHGGDTQLFHADLHLMLNTGIGMFVAFNGLGKERAAVKIRGELFQAFVNRYLPNQERNEPTTATAPADAKLVSGWYLSSRRENGFPLLFLPDEIDVAAQPDGTITMSETPAGTPKKWREVGPLRYREVGGPAHLAFIRSGTGMSVAADYAPVVIYQRVGFWKRIDVLEWIGAVSLLIFLGTLVLWPICGGVRRHYRRPLQLAPLAARLRTIARLACAIAVLDVIGWVALLSHAMTTYSIPDSGLAILYSMGVLCIVGAFGAIASAVVAWSGSNPIAAKLGETLPAIAGIVFTWIVLVFGLANFNFHY